MNFPLREHLSIACALGILACLEIPGLAEPTQVGKIHAGQISTSKTSDSPETVVAAVKFYDNGQFEQARQILENAMQSGQYDAHVCFYAALANRKCGAESRADKLFEYVVQNFPASKEAKLIQKSNPTAAAASSASATSPAERRSLLASSTSAGKAEIGQRPFTAADIAKDGYYGVQQGGRGNCWFEASLAALAALPKGQVMIANLIRTGPANSYVVNFFDGSEFPVKQDEFKKCRDHALWARIIECAERKKFPDDTPNADSRAVYGDAGMSIITGRLSEGTDPGTMTEEEICNFIYAPVKSQNPVIACTKGKYAPDIRQTLVPNHVYSIIDFEPNKKMIVLRNPWGANPKNLNLENDPQHLAFEEKKDGVIRLSVEQFRKNFRGLRRSFI